MTSSSGVAAGRPARRTCGHQTGRTVARHRRPDGQGAGAQRHGRARHGAGERQHRRARTFATTVSLAAHETKTVAFAVHLDSPKVWWPAGMGGRPLYGLDLTASVNGTPSDTAHQTFGIRDVQAPLNSDGARQYRINEPQVADQGRRLVTGRVPPLGPDLCRGPPEVRPRHLAPEHHPPGRTHRAGRVLRPGRPLRHPDPPRLGVLRQVGGPGQRRRDR
ncbi:hypothetical protein ACRAWF_02735 [Streptomyces sp. L7]